MSFTIRIFTILSFIVQINIFGQKVHISEPQIIIPSTNLPNEITPQRSNNNLDITQFKDRFYVAFRTAAHHFPSKSAIIYIMSSPDLNDWKFEHKFQTGNDLREPRFLILNDELFLYCFEGGKKIYEFDPQHIWLSNVNKNTGKWEDQIIEKLDGFVPWRLKVYNDKALLSAYWGKDLYGNHQGQLRLFESTDGKVWTALSDKPQVDLTGAEEGEFEFDNEGNLWACVRLEGEGALICYAEKDKLYEWKTFRSKKKYDSSCMFRYKNDIYLIARRNKDGNADKAPKWLPTPIIRGYNLTRYSLTPKTTALYKLNTTLKDFEHIIDLPGCGDNAFPAITQAGPNSFYILNYSNNFDNPDRTWFSGQFSPTFIYYLKITFED